MIISLTQQKLLWWGYIDLFWLLFCRCGAGMGGTCDGNLLREHPMVHDDGNSQAMVTSPESR